MYCRNCGEQIPDNAKFCTNCGSVQNKQVSQANQGHQQNYNQSNNFNRQNLVGFSNKINDPAFSRHIRKSKRGAKIFSLFILIAAPLGFAIAGSVSNEFDNPQALLMGLAIGVFYYLFAIIWSKRHFNKKSWEGVVIDKDIKTKRDSKNYSYNTYKEYTVRFKGNNGEKHKISIRRNREYFDYFKIGDRVRFHGGLNTIEKFDKSRDSIIYCNACGTKNDITNDFCRRCKVPLLK